MLVFGKAKIYCYLYINMLRTVVTLALLGLVGTLHGSESWRLYDDSEVAIIQVSVAPEDLTWMYENVHSDSEHIASVQFTNIHIDETIDSVGFRLRGNTSRTSAKKSFKISFNTFVPGRQFYGVDKINLNGEHNDPSIIRSKLCWDHFHKLGLTASAASHAALYINDEYFGLYINVEHIDDEFLENHYEDPSGNLWKCLWPADLDYRGPDPASYWPWIDGDRPYDLKTNTDEYDFSQLARLISLVNNTPAEDLADSLESILLVDEVLKYFAMNVLLGGWDDYWFLRNNFYLYHEPSIDRFHWIPYDYDNTFSIDWFGIEWSEVNPYVFANFDNPPTPRPLAVRLMENEQYRDLYTHFIEFIRDNILDLSLWDAELLDLKSLITPWAEEDLYRVLDYGFSMDDFHASYSIEHYENQHVKRGLMEFVNLRMASVGPQLSYTGADPIVYDVWWEPQHPAPDDSIIVHAAAFGSLGLDGLTIAFHPGELTVILEYPMVYSPVVSTQNVTLSDRWVGIIPPLGDHGHGRFQVVALDLTGQGMVYPRNDFISLEVVEVVNSHLVINELLAINQASNPDPLGEYDDWVEIYNPTDAVISLSGLHLTDDPANLTKWSFPGGLQISPTTYLVVWCDNDEGQTGIHTNFKLDGDGEHLALVGGDGATIVDSISFPAQTTDVAYARIPDAGNQWGLLDPPTPGSSNTTSYTRVPGITPSETALYPCFPNPFNPSTQVKFALGQPEKVQIRVFDVLGSQRHILFDGPGHPGDYSLQWTALDASGRLLSPGIYFIQMQTETYLHTQKVLLLP